jgi:hypothetical protein
MPPNSRRADPERIADRRGDAADHALDETAARHQGRCEGQAGEDQGPRLSWPLQDGDYRLVLMNADASPAMDADVRFALVLPSFRGIGVTVLVASLGITQLGGLLLGLGLPTPRSTGTPRGAGAAPLVTAGGARKGTPGGHGSGNLAVSG